MLLPIGDYPNPPGYRAWVTWGLMAANLAVYLLVNLPLGGRAPDPGDPLLAEYLRVLGRELPGLSASGLLQSLSAFDLFVFAHGYKPGAPEAADLFASMFLHAGLLHLGGNMLYLWIFGDNVEHRLGRLGFLVTYLACGAVASLAFAAFAGDSMIPLVGASGAISGVLGLYFLLFPRNRVRLFVFVLFFFQVLSLPARWVLILYVLLDNLLPMLLGAQSGVAFGAHLGGFAAGLGVAFAGERLGWRAPWSRPGRLRLGGGRAGEHGLEALRRALGEGDGDRALEALGRLDEARLAALGPEECAALAELLVAAGHEAAAARLLRRCLALHPLAPGIARVYLALGLLRLAQGQPIAAYHHLLAALEHRPDAATEARARQALQAIERRLRGQGGPGRG